MVVKVNSFMSLDMHAQLLTFMDSIHKSVKWSWFGQSIKRLAQAVGNKIY